MLVENSVGAPEYLNGDFFNDVLENGLREPSITTKDISLTSGSSSGENYCSQIYRVKVSYQREEKDETEQASVIVKSIPLPDELNFLEDMKVYHKEKVFYMDILPKLEILMDGTKFAPRCFYAIKKPVYTIAFEDMSAQGFTMADRMTGLDEHHTKLALQKLGQFHAVSMVYARKEPEMMTQFETGLLDAKAMVPSCVLYKLLYKYLGYEIKVVSQWKGYEKIVEKMREYHKNFQTRLIASQVHRKGELKVLNHGDFWINNMLFKYDKAGSPSDLIFLDFQMSMFGSPGVDLNYFLYASVQLDVLKRLDTLLRTYYVALKNTLVDLHYDKIPSYEDIVREFDENAAYGMFTMFGPLPVMTMDKSNCDGNSFESLAEGDNSDEKMMATFSSKRLTEHLKYSLKEIDKRGGLDSKN